MTDRELLEAAAKAAGLKTLADRFDVWITEEDGSPVRRWKPLTDDGDALRLAVALRFDISIYEDGSCCVSVTNEDEPFGVLLADELASNNNGNACTALRRAIVRAAAMAPAAPVLGAA